MSGASPALYPASSSPLLQVPVRLTAGYAPLHAASVPITQADQLVGRLLTNGAGAEDHETYTVGEAIDFIGAAFSCSLLESPSSSARGRLCLAGHAAGRQQQSRANKSEECRIRATACAA